MTEREQAGMRSVAMDYAVAGFVVGMFCGSAYAMLMYWLTG